MIKKVRIGYIGLGRRGMSVMEKNIAEMKDVEVVYISDLSKDRMERGAKIIREKMGNSPKMTTNYRDILSDATVDAVFIMNGWDGRVEMAMEAMRAGKYVAIEVGCAETVESCFDLIKTHEETKMPVMMLENCCYGRREMMVLNMVKQGLFGELVYCTGGYHHYLNECELFKDINSLYVIQTMNHPRRPSQKMSIHLRMRMTKKTSSIQCQFKHGRGMVSSRLKMM